ncbi:MAG: zinc ribbon domain-containing protein [Candidatus Lokiarchaeota archaeon]|nr:zinc ribbon domain-containing protein [Candidatus Lokiarchaeota archaeon]
MGWGRVIKSGIVGMLLLIPMAYISFRFLNLTEGVTGGLIANIDDALVTLTEDLGPLSLLVNFIAGAAIGALLIFLFPIHWCLFYRPDDIMLIIAITLPWILCCVITSAIFAHTPRGGVHTSLAIGIGYAIILSVLYIVLALVLPLGSTILDGLLMGLTDMPYLLAVLTAIFEGTLVGAVFGAFVGSLKYKPKGGKKKKKKVKIKAETTETGELFPREIAEEETVSTPTSDFCKNCGARLTDEDLFCINCGAKK